MKTLKDTVKLMTSFDYRERFVAEYEQLVIRYKGLRNTLDKWDRSELDFTLICPRSTYNLQLKQWRIILLFLKQEQLWKALYCKERINYESEHAITNMNIGVHMEQKIVNVIYMMKEI